ncbi:nuclease domain-containing protein 1 [Niveomyces insectorum RCEF 264]|uniref:Probable endonuclease LCL3 n=1 Tax=Niveomyces insectorum RCEF 264 TaxID=1081102 RepID=A0A167WY42_9HYPO|nr:nuclease domain-containing protein 1 [Niveomyces insectorum RCEF 264]
MRWPGSWGESKDNAAAASSSSSSSSSSPSSSSSSFSDIPKRMTSWADSLNKTDWRQYKDPHTWIPPALAVAAALGFSAFYRSYLRRIPGTSHIQPRFFRRRSLLGKVTSVGDGDNFHLFHTPGGRLAGWGWLRKVPTYRKDLKGKTIPVRIAGVDAPEGAHFGRPAQPYSGEALDFLTHYLLGRRVRAYLYRRDQYDRVVARVIVRRFFFFRRDVGLQMLKRGLATCYEAKSGAEFGGREAQYRVAEAKAKARKRGLWSGGSGPGDLETPREYKTRMAAGGATDEATDAAAAAAAANTANAAAGKTTPATATTTAAATAASSAARPTVTVTPSSSTPTPKPATATTTPPPPPPPPTPGKAGQAARSSTGTQTTASSWGKGPSPGGRR